MCSVIFNIVNMKNPSKWVYRTYSCVCFDYFNTLYILKNSLCTFPWYKLCLC